MDIFVAEIVGTMILIGCGVNASVSLGRTNGHGAGWIVITTGWGLAVAMGVYAVGRLSGPTSTRRSRSGYGRSARSRPATSCPT